MKNKKAREAIISTATKLFYKQGYSSTGINQIIKEAGIAKSTLYQHFRSKEDLLLAYLEETGTMTMNALKEAVKKGEKPVEKIIEIFTFLEQLVAEIDFRGCHFLNIVYEMPDVDELARSYVKKQKDAVRGLIAETLMPLDRPELADVIYTLYEGALIAYKIHNEPWPIVASKNAILRMV